MNTHTHKKITISLKYFVIITRNIFHLLVFGWLIGASYLAFNNFSQISSDVADPNYCDPVFFSFFIKNTIGN